MRQDPATTSPVRAYLAALIDEYRSLEAGAVATYIPELARADPSSFAICICTSDGNVVAVGDTDIEFTIQSISKPFVYGVALEDRGRDEVLARVGVEPSGNPFNAIIVDDTSRPYNPMVNAGAIVTTGLVSDEHRILDVLGKCAGRALTVDEQVYASERATGDRNRAIAFLMRSFDAIEGDVDAVVDLYFRQCSVLVTCQDLAVMAATLANRGRNPVTGERALDERYVESVMSVMSTCGMYDASGEWMYTVGLPAKSGVAGGVIAVLPGQLGIGVFSPPLDERGNSTRGMKVCQRIAADFDLHPLRFWPDVGAVVRRTYTCAQTRSSRVRTGVELELLDKHGGSARVFELQGDLFFGSTERVYRAVVDALDGVDAVVLDFKRVSGIDASAETMLTQLRSMLEAADRVLVLADTPGSSDLDGALEWCEERILSELGVVAFREPAELADQELLRGLRSEELEAIAAVTRYRTCTAGEVLFREGDAASSMFFVLSGSLAVSIPLRAGETSRAQILAKLGPGVAVGEMAILDDAVRSADVVVERDAVLAEVGLGDLQRIGAQHPGLTASLNANLARVLSERLRRANAQVRALSH